MAHIGFDTPLDGFKVLDLSRLFPGPFCSLLLADMGAEVIKVEAPPGGDYARWYPPMVGDYGAFFAAINRGKRSLALNLKHPDGPDVIKKLVAECDVVLESFRPGVAERLGVGWETLVEINPRLVYCAITGYGQDGPLASRAGHDLNYIALAGALEQTGRPGETPVLPGFQLADVGGGALYATSAICAALLKVGRTGKGAFLDISMTEGALSFHLPLQSQVKAGEKAERGNAMLSGALPCYRVYPTKDGRYLAVGGLEPKFWMSFCQAIELPDVMQQGLATGKEADQVAERVANRLAEKDLEEWLPILEQADACVEPVLHPSEVPGHPQHQARNVFFEIKTDDGKVIPQTATPLTPPDRAELTAPPVLGADSRQILAEAGYDEEAVDRLLGGAVTQA